MSCIIKTGVSVEWEYSAIANLNKVEDNHKKTPTGTRASCSWPIAHDSTFFLILPKYDHVAPFTNCDQESDVSVLALLELIHNAGYCYGDLKPSNMVWRTIGNQKITVLIDFGVMTPLTASTLKEITPDYDLDYPQTPSIMWDRVCRLAPSLLELFQLPNQSN